MIFCDMQGSVTVALAAFKPAPNTKYIGLCNRIRSNYLCSALSSVGRKDGKDEGGTQL